MRLLLSVCSSIAAYAVRTLSNNDSSYNFFFLSILLIRAINERKIIDVDSTRVECARSSNGAWNVMCRIDSNRQATSNRIITTNLCAGGDKANAMIT